jgi:hypothetical protein
MQLVGARAGARRADQADGPDLGGRPMPLGLAGGSGAPTKCARNEPVWGAGIAACRDEHVDDLPDLADRSVDVAPPAGPLTEVSSTNRRSPTECRQGVGSLGREPGAPVDPLGDGEVSDVDTPLGERLFDVAGGQAAAQAPADGGDDHLGRDAEAGGRRPRAWSRRGRRDVMPAASLELLKIERWSHPGGLAVTSRGRRCRFWRLLRLVIQPVVPLEGPHVGEVHVPFE